MKLLGKIATLALALTAMAIRAEALEPVPIAVLDFDYSDTSGEPQDQTEQHQARLHDFAERIRAALSASGAYRVVAVECAKPPCSAKNYEAEELFAMTRRAGAKLMLFGGLHKMSTLVQMGRVELIDVVANRLIEERRLSFRGDTDEAWRRAADYVAQKMTTRTQQEDLRQ